MNVLARLSHILTETNKMLLYNSFVECYFNYSSCIWQFCSNYDTYRLEKLQKKALKFILLSFNCSYNELLIKCNKCPLYIVRLYKLMEICFKIRNGLFPEYLHDLVTIKQSAYDVHAMNNLCIPKYNTITYGKK